MEARKRQSIANASTRLAEMVLKGEGTGTKAAEQAGIVLRLCKGTGRYVKQYATEEERVLHRHLNLYINKLNKAQTEVERVRWQAKIKDQRAKIRHHDGALDLDGL